MASATGTYTTRARVKSRLSISTTDWDSQIDVVVDAMNQYVESPQGCGRVIAPISSATYVLDGQGLSFLYFPKGIRAVTVLTIGDYSGDSVDTVTAADILLRPLDHERSPGWPAMYLYLSDHPASTVTRSVFPEGRSNVNLTCTAGWAAIPDDLAEMADTVAAVAFHNLEQGNQPIPNTDEQGRPIVARFFSGKDFDTLKAYRIKQPQVFD